MDSQFKEEFRLEIPKEIKRRRKKKKASKPVFKKYDQHQMNLMPVSYEEMIEETHLVRVVNSVIDKLNIESLVQSYKGGGSSSYNPVMLLKVWIYAIAMDIYSGRQLAKALRENIYFMWLSGSNKPDFRTLNTFRSGRLKGVIEEIFTDTVIFLGEKGLVDLRKYFVDGTPLRANANKNSYVWKSNTERYMESIQQRVHEIFNKIEEVNKEEDKKYGKKDLEEMGEQTRLTGEEIKEQVKRLNKIIEESELGKTQKRKAESLLRKVEKKELPKIEQYESQKKILESRGSYSKTDKDATFLRMKNYELLPAYEILTGTENQYIINYSIHQSTAEGSLFINHIENYYKKYGKYPGIISADSAYGTEENSEYVEKHGIENYMKYSSFHQEMTKEYLENKFHKDHLKYDQQTDTFVCPKGREIIFKEEEQRLTRTGYPQTARKYQCVNCKWCRFAKKCKTGKGPKNIQINRNLERCKDIMRKNLRSEKGIELRKQRNVDVETVFGDIKWNHGYRRFSLRGKEKVNVEMGLLSIAHNLRKVALTIN